MRALPLLDKSVIESLRRAAEAVASKHATTLPDGFIGRPDMASDRTDR